GSIFLNTSPSLAVNIQEIETPKGFHVWLVEDHSVPLVSIDIAFQKSGASYAPHAREGLPVMLTDLLFHGVANLDRHQFGQYLENVGIDSVEAYINKDNFLLSTKVVTSSLSHAFKTFSLILKHIRLDRLEVEKVRKQYPHNAVIATGNATDIAQSTLWKILFEGHPYETPLTGTLEGIQGVTISDLKAFMKDHFTKDNLIISVAGDITPSKLSDLVDQTFGSLPEKSHIKNVAKPEPKLSGNIIVRKKDSPQSVILFAQKGKLRSDPDFFALYLLVYLLGGEEHVSRLSEEIRVKRGLAYNTQVWLDWNQHTSLITGEIHTKNASVKKVTQIIRKEWKKLQDNGITQQELSEAKAYFLGNYPMNFTSLSKTSKHVLNLQLDHLPSTYPEDRETIIRNLKLEDINRVAKKLFNPNTLTFIVIGKPEGL
ncbi:MAG: insulinase family protein, partial [Alphaproteobacteria bacterium]|nr:insulinase family protein [Alphaproteobacteria bacterium]